MDALATAPTETPKPLFGAVLCVAAPAGDGTETVGQAARVAGTRAVFDLAEPSEGVDTILARCGGHDLLAVPAGPLADALIARTRLPVLVVRPTAPGASFPESVLVAVDDTPEAHAAARIGARVAARSGGHIAVVAAPQHDEHHQHALAGHLATIERICSRRPLVLDEYGDPASSIVAAAAGLDASLVLLGSRAQRTGPSVSAQVARRAPCSVLVLRGTAPSRHFSPAA
jgi:nucleotide-binding universal stress UspA family protein